MSRPRQHRQKFWEWIVSRLEEPSTYTGLAAMLVAGANFAPYPQSWWMLTAAGMMGAIAVGAKEKGPPPPPS